MVAENGLYLQKHWMSKLERLPSKPSLVLLVTILYEAR